MRESENARPICRVCIEYHHDRGTPIKDMEEIVIGWCPNFWRE